MFKIYEILFVIVLLGLGVWYIYPPSAEEKYDKYYALWKSHDIKRYAYTLQGYSSSTGPILERVIVFNNKIINDKNVSQFRYTIDDKFHQLRKKKKLINMKYDHTYGYPKYNNYSPEIYDEDGNIMLGGGYFYQIKNFRMLPEKLSNEYQPVCAKNIIIEPCLDKVCPILSVNNKTYKNRDMMDIEGAYFNYEGVCKE